MQYCLTTLLLISLSTFAGNHPASNFILSNVNIVDVEHRRILPNKSVFVEHDTITAIVDGKMTHHDKLQIIDAKQGYITPGLIDMHVHMYEKGALTLSLSHGVTHVRMMNGFPDQLAWRDSAEKGEFAGSTATVSSPIISGYKGSYFHTGVDSALQAKQAVKRFKALGFDLIKAYGNLNEAALNGLLKEANTLNLPVAKHGPHGAGSISLADMAHLQSFEHVEDIYQGQLDFQFDDDKLRKIITEFQKVNVPITPTLNIYNQLTLLSEKKETFLNSIPIEYSPTIIALEEKNGQVKRWLNASPMLAKHNIKTLAFLKSITGQLHTARIPLLVGSDSGVLLSPHGLATHNEMDLMMQSGLSSFDVLQAATIHAAKALNLDKKIGKIEVQHQADFIYTKNNPINAITRLKYPTAVVKKGIWYSEEALLTMRKDVVKSRSVWHEIKVLFKAIELNTM